MYYNSTEFFSLLMHILKLSGVTSRGADISVDHAGMGMSAHEFLGRFCQYLF
jgi:hypothetical protein